jgi:hypothetical protein
LDEQSGPRGWRECCIGDISGGARVAPLLAGGYFLFVSWQSSLDEERILNAPTRTGNEVFTSTPCRATLLGNVHSITHTQVVFDIDDRQVTMPVRLAGPLSSAGGPVRVTFYRGQPIRADGPRLKADAAGSPADNTKSNRWRALVPLATGALLTAAYLAVTVTRKIKAAHQTDEGTHPPTEA